jgi:hypothetical protein
LRPFFAFIGFGSAAMVPNSIRAGSQRLSFSDCSGVRPGASGAANARSSWSGNEREKLTHSERVKLTHLGLQNGRSGQER